MALIDWYGAMMRCKECVNAIAENTVHGIHLLFHEDSRHNSGLHIRTDQLHSMPQGSGEASLVVGLLVVLQLVSYLV